MILGLVLLGQGSCELRVRRSDEKSGGPDMNKLVDAVIQAGVALSGQSDQTAAAPLAPPIQVSTASSFKPPCDQAKDKDRGSSKARGNSGSEMQRRRPRCPSLKDEIKDIVQKAVEDAKEKMRKDMLEAKAEAYWNRKSSKKKGQRRLRPYRCRKLTICNLKRKLAEEQKKQLVAVPVKSYVSQRAHAAIRDQIIKNYLKPDDDLANIDLDKDYH